MEEKISKIKNYAEWGFGLLLVVLTAYCSASLFLNILARKMIVSPRMVTVKKNLPEQQKTKSIEEYLSSVKPLFPEAAPSATPSNQSGTPEGSEGPQESAMKLVATILGEGASLAVINMGTKDELAEVGRLIANYKVMEIYKNKVILETGGRKVVLRMKFGEPDEPTPTPEASKTKAPEGAPGVETKEISRREFDESINPPDRVAREVGFAPVSRDGRPYGIQLTFLKPGSFLQKLGFLPGDILKSVNTKPVYNIEDGMLVYQIMKNEDTVDVNLDRGGRFQQLQIVFK